MGCLVEDRCRGRGERGRSARFDDEEVVGDGNVQVIEGSVIVGSWSEVFAMVMSTKLEWVLVESRKYCDPELQVQWVWPSGQVEAVV